MDLDVIRKECGEAMLLLTETLQLNETQSILLSCFVASDAYGGSDLVGLCAHLGCSTIDMYMMLDEIDELVGRGYVMKAERRSEEGKYRIAPVAFNAFRRNEASPSMVVRCKTDEELVGVLDGMFNDCGRKRTTPQQLRCTIAALLRANPDLSLARRLQGFHDTLAEVEFMFLVLALLYWIKGGCGATLGSADFALMGIEEKLELESVLMGVKGRLLPEGLIEPLMDADEVCDIEFTIAKGIRKEMFPDKADAVAPRRMGGKMGGGREGIRLVAARRHPVKQLFLNAEERRSFDELSSLLTRKNLRQVNSRLKAAGMSSGFTCLFYGAPGTGKTEAAFQLANLTGRDLYQVNMSEMHDMWVGESEKNVRRLFSAYQDVRKKSKQVPILLLNEADAVLGKRLEAVYRSTDQMENRIQNIFLQELEDFQGILIATTNLAQNLDGAFERRFLYKVQFNLPDADVRRRLWQSMLPALQETEAAWLSEEFVAFAGGQIANVARKVTVDEVLHGERTPLDRIAVYCRQEHIASARNPIGFVA